MMPFVDAMTRVEDTFSGIFYVGVSPEGPWKDFLGTFFMELGNLTGKTFLTIRDVQCFLAELPESDDDITEYCIECIDLYLGFGHLLQEEKQYLQQQLCSHESAVARLFTALALEDEAVLSSLNTKWPIVPDHSSGPVFAESKAVSSTVFKDILDLLIDRIKTIEDGVRFLVDGPRLGLQARGNDTEPLPDERLDIEDVPPICVCTELEKQLESGELALGGKAIELISYESADSWGYDVFQNDIYLFSLDASLDRENLVIMRRLKHKAF